MHERTKRQLALVALTLLAILTWITCLLLLIQITSQLLDTLQFIVDLAQMS